MESTDIAGGFGEVQPTGSRRHRMASLESIAEIEAPATETQSVKRVAGSFTLRGEIFQDAQEEER